jgi:hypothetical protein
VFWVTAALDWERRGEADLLRRREGGREGGREGNINAGAPLDVGMLIFAFLNLHTPPHTHKQPLIYLRRISDCD